MDISEEFLRGIITQEQPDDLDIKAQKIEKEVQNIFDQEDILLNEMKNIEENIKKKRRDMMNCKNVRNHLKIEANTQRSNIRKKLKKELSELMDERERLRVQYENRKKST